MLNLGRRHNTSGLVMLIHMRDGDLLVDGGAHPLSQLLTLLLPVLGERAHTREREGW